MGRGGREFWEGITGRSFERLRGGNRWNEGLLILYVVVLRWLVDFICVQAFVVGVDISFATNFVYFYILRSFKYSLMLTFFQLSLYQFI